MFDDQRKTSDGDSTHTTTRIGRGTEVLGRRGGAESVGRTATNGRSTPVASAGDVELTARIPARTTTPNLDFISTWMLVPSSGIFQGLGSGNPKELGQQGGNDFGPVVRDLGVVVDVNENASEIDPLDGKCEGSQVNQGNGDQSSALEDLVGLDPNIAYFVQVSFKDGS